MDMRASFRPEAAEFFTWRALSITFFSWFDESRAFCSPSIAATLLLQGQHENVGKSSQNQGTRLEFMANLLEREWRAGSIIFT